MSVIDDIKTLHTDALRSIGEAADSETPEKLRIEVVGKSGTLTGYLRAMGQIEKEHRAEVGKAVNAARNEIEAALEAKKAELGRNELEERMKADVVDITLPGRAQQMGTRHLINAISDEIPRSSSVWAIPWRPGPEVETDWHNHGAQRLY